MPDGIFLYRILLYADVRKAERNLSMITVILVVLINTVAAFLQGAIGFGYAIVSMALMPHVLPMQECACISAVGLVAIGIQMCWKLRKHLEVRKVAIPVSVCLASTNLGMLLLNCLPEQFLKWILAGTLLLFSGYFLYTQTHGIAIQGSRIQGAALGFLAGLGMGMFNMAGPFFMGYYYSVSKDNLAYKANMECSFLCAGLYSLFTHLVLGDFNAETAVCAGVSLAGILIAGGGGILLYQRLNREKLKRVICILLPFMAVWLLVR